MIFNKCEVSYIKNNNNNNLHIPRNKINKNIKLKFYNLLYIALFSK